MRAGFEVYRAFSQDHQKLKAKITDKGKKLDLPILATGGERSVMTQVSSLQFRALGCT